MAADDEGTAADDEGTAADDEGATADDDGATAAGLQALPAMTTAAAAKAILSVLFTDRALHADHVGGAIGVAASGYP